MMDEKELRKITNNLYIWNDSQRLRDETRIFVKNNDKWYDACFISNQILKDGYHMDEKEMSIIQATRDLRSHIEEAKDVITIDLAVRNFYADVTGEKHEQPKEEKKETNPPQSQIPRAPQNEQKEKKTSYDYVEPEEMAKLYNIPPAVANMFFKVIERTNNKTGKVERKLYIDNAGLLYLGAKGRGYDAIQTVKTESWTKDNEEYETRIYPKRETDFYEKLAKVIEAISHLKSDLQEQALEAVMADAFRYTNGFGRGDAGTIKAAEMQIWRPEMGQTRSVNRAMRLFCGYGGSSYEELEDAKLNIIKGGD